MKAFEQWRVCAHLCVCVDPALCVWMWLFGTGINTFRLYMLRDDTLWNLLHFKNTNKHGNLRQAFCHLWADFTRLVQSGTSHLQWKHEFKDIFNAHIGNIEFYCSVFSVYCNFSAFNNRQYHHNLVNSQWCNNKRRFFLMAPLELFSCLNCKAQCDWNGGYFNIQQYSSEDDIPRFQFQQQWTRDSSRDAFIQVKCACWIGMFCAQRPQWALSEINKHSNGYDSNAPSINVIFNRSVNYLWQNYYPNRLQWETEKWEIQMI